MTWKKLRGNKAGAGEDKEQRQGYKMLGQSVPTSKRRSQSTNVFTQLELGNNSAADIPFALCY